MKIYLHLQSDSELICYEAMALAFVLASFDHQVQLHITGAALTVLLETTSRLHGMIQSIELYDMPSVWVDNWNALGTQPNLQKVCQTTPSMYQLATFDSRLHF